MPRKFCYFTFLILGVALCAASASATPLTINSITVANQWQLGESDSGAAINATGAATTVDDLGGWNMTATGSPTYVAGAPSAYSTGPTALAMNFANPVAGTVSQYYKNFNSTSGTYISSTSNTNWGFDFWFNANVLPASGQEENMVCFGGRGGWYTSNTAVEVELYNQGTSAGMLYVSNWSGSAWTSSVAVGTPTVGTWYHVVYADENGTGYMWVNDTPIGGTNSGGSGIPVPNLNSVADNVLVACRNYNNSIANGFNGAIDEVRLFSFAQGTFNLADTDVTPEPGTLALLSAGLASLLAYAWRKRK